MTVEELLKLNLVKPSELCRLGGKVTIFTSEKADDEYHWKRYHGKAEIVSVPAIEGEDWHAHKQRIIAAAEAALRPHGGTRAGTSSILPVIMPSSAFRLSSDGDLRAAIKRQKDGTSMKDTP